MTGPSFTDTHCHLNYHDFKNDLPDVITRAGLTNIQKIMVPGFNLASCQDAVQISDQYSSCYAAVGIHPNDAQEWNETAEQELQDLLHHPRVYAVGEIGLDYYRDHCPPDVQIKALRSQLNLAAKFNKPVIIHIRESVDDTFEILFAWQLDLEKNHHTLAAHPGIFHAFPGTLDEAMQAVTHQFKIGIGGPVTFKNAKEKHVLAVQLPLESIVLETDAPFLTPHPYRGKRNEPAYIPLIAQKITEVKNLPIEELAKITTQNAQWVFRWD